MGSPLKFELATIAKARRLLGYQPSIKIGQGLELTVQAFMKGNP